MRDKLTGAIFRVSAANVQQDAVLYNDSWWDTTWDAVWQSQVATDEEGWSAEIRIPLSQLRFTNADRQTWGINVERFVRRKNEASWLEMVPKNENGNASRMLELTGLDGMHPRRNLELLPYVAGRAEFVQPSKAGNPFNDGSRGFGAAGLDMKWGLTSNLTVSATVNPDFGQVEVDPAVVNLTAFETFFSEKRPFFLEGSQIFNNFGRGGANDYWGFNNSEPQIFYSRRIGRAPQLAASASTWTRRRRRPSSAPRSSPARRRGAGAWGCCRRSLARRRRARAPPGWPAAAWWSRSRAIPWRACSARSARARASASWPRR